MLVKAFRNTKIFCKFISETGTRNNNARNFIKIHSQLFVLILLIKRLESPHLMSQQFQQTVVKVRIIALVCLNFRLAVAYLQFPIQVRFSAMVGHSSSKVHCSSVADLLLPSYDLELWSVTFTFKSDLACQDEKKAKAYHTRYWPLGPELIPV